VLNLGVQKMSASNLPLGVCQRIEQRWTAQIKRLQEERDLKAKATSPELVDEQEGAALVGVVEWGKPRDR
jgi:hypothetical protein